MNSETILKRIGYNPHLMDNHERNIALEAYKLGVSDTEEKKEEVLKVTLRRLVRQDWYKTETTKTGWDSNGWIYEDNGVPMDNDWFITEHLRLDKFGNPILGIAEKETIID